MRHQESHRRELWGGFNNLGLCATAIGVVLNEVKELTLPKVMLIMPLIMHEATLRFLAKGSVRPRQIAAFASMNPEFIMNFSKRYEDSLVVSINAIQYLISTEHVDLTNNVKLVKPFTIDDSFGQKASLLTRATRNLSELLSSTEEELYLNLRVKL